MNDELAHQLLTGFLKIRALCGSNFTSGKWISGFWDENFLAKALTDYGSTGKRMLRCSITIVPTISSAMWVPGG